MDDFWLVVLGCVHCFGFLIGRLGVCVGVTAEP
jgi:hypothetical protein